MGLAVSNVQAMTEQLRRGLIATTPALELTGKVPDARTSSGSHEDGLYEARVNTIERFWSLLRSWLRPHPGISHDKLPLHLGFLQFVHNALCSGKALHGGLVAGLVG